VSFHWMLFHRLLLKQLVTMEVIQWTSLWNEFLDEFESEKNLLGGSLGDKAAEDLRQRIIEHVIYFQLSYLHNSYAFFFQSTVEFGCSFICNVFSFQNIIVVSKYYSKITVKRVAELLCLSIQVLSLSVAVLYTCFVCSH
jgi:26S proteasome regulatory subunit N5